MLDHTSCPHWGKCRAQRGDRGGELLGGVTGTYDCPAAQAFGLWAVYALARESATRLATPTTASAVLLPQRGMLQFLAALSLTQSSIQSATGNPRFASKKKILLL